MLADHINVFFLLHLIIYLTCVGVHTWKESAEDNFQKWIFSSYLVAFGYQIQVVKLN